MYVVRSSSVERTQSRPTTPSKSRSARSKTSGGTVDGRTRFMRPPGCRGYAHRRALKYIRRDSEMHALILKGVADIDPAQSVSVINFRRDAGPDKPAQADPNTREIRIRRCRPSRVPADAAIEEWRQLHRTIRIVRAYPGQRQSANRHAQLERAGEGIVGRRKV